MQKTENNKLKVYQGESAPFGVCACQNGWQFCCAADIKNSFVLNLYKKNGQLIEKINLMPYHIAGNVYSVCVQGMEVSAYLFEADGKPFQDIYKKCMVSRRKWGEKIPEGIIDKSAVYNASFDWEGDAPLKLKYHQVISYSLHVRGFTKHVSSGVSGKGTFSGIIEKIPYLNDLGVNQLEILPAYEFYELDSEKEQRGEDYQKYAALNTEEKAAKINFWGFKEGFYFVPKSAYAQSEDAVTEFKTMVKALHKNGIELVMQFYFPKHVNRNLVLDCLNFWVTDYHVDGFHLKGDNLPIDLIATQPLLADTKLYYTFYDKDRIFMKGQNVNHCLAEVNQDFQTDIRRFLKSDEDMLQAFLFRQRRNPKDIHVINYLTSYEGFTLNDLVSYDYKHNDANGEDNKDGNNYNYSWNCGIEGSTRKRAVKKLRMQQMKNAFALLLFSQSTPMLSAGDEFCNSQNGNNNAYCQDNETTWLNWKKTLQTQELYAFVKQLIALRKMHPILHKEEEFRIMDYAACGYPDLSYHADAAWYPKMENHIRHIGIMLCGKYARLDRNKEDDFFFIAYNMHWEPHAFGLPKLPKGLHWEYLLDTTEDIDTQKLSALLEEKQDELTVGPRSILVLTGR